MDALPNITVTFLIEFKSKFLLISRGKDEDNFPSLWAFPGGKCEIGETIIDTLRREILEETNLEILEEGKFLNTYYFKKSVGVTFYVKAKNDNVILSDEIVDYVWVETLEDLRKYNCIPGIHNHLYDAINARDKGNLEILENMRLIPEKYINK